MAKTDGSVDSRQNGQVSALEDEVERYRRASEDASQQLDWCIGYLHGRGKAESPADSQATGPTSDNTC